MPSISWNKATWAKNLKTYQAGKLKNQAGQYGDQWGDPEAKPHLKTVKDTYLLPYVKPDLVALEIGSGGGRWTQYLTKVKRLYCVDLNPEMIAYLRQRFASEKHLEYVVTNGSDLPGVPERSIDFVFTYGTWVHCDLDIIEGYLESMKRVMKPGARAVMQFSDKRKPAAQKNEGFADNDPIRMRALLEKHGFSIELVDEATLNHSAVIVATRGR
jgi:ubiquinone/menaquinone biosynthesis C-methylase UbiE